MHYSTRQLVSIFERDTQTRGPELEHSPRLSSIGRKDEKIPMAPARQQVNMSRPGVHWRTRTHQEITRVSQCNNVCTQQNPLFQCLPPLLSSAHPVPRSHVLRGAVAGSRRQNLVSRARVRPPTVHSYQARRRSTQPADTRHPCREASLLAPKRYRQHMVGNTVGRSTMVKRTHAPTGRERISETKYYHAGHSVAASFAVRSGRRTVVTTTRKWVPDG